MKTGIFNAVIILLIMIYPFCGCYHNFQPREVNIDNDLKNFSITSPTKCHVADGSVIIFRHGFSVSSNRILGIGERFFFTGKKEINSVNNFLLDSIVAITTYEDYTGARSIANGSLAILGAALGGLTAYCIGCPKCCFGSCPTVYTYNNDSSFLETELFSSSISKILEENDLDLLNQKIHDDGIYKLNITNEALETHYIDKFNLILTEHPKGTTVFPNIEKGYTLINKTSTPLSVVNSKGEDLYSEISIEDASSYRSGMAMANELKSGPVYDHIEITSEIPDNVCNAKLLIGYKNTLLSTILFYDVVLGSQGIEAVKWINKMNNDQVYATDFKMIYDKFSGIDLEVFDNGKWIYAGKIPDAGPICWKKVAAEIPVNGGKLIKLRLKFIPDNFMIDYIGIEFGENDRNKIIINNLIPYEVKNNSENSTENVKIRLAKTDKDYLITNPGDSYSLAYYVKKRNDFEQTLLISSRGYYNEWIRGSWIKNDTTVRSFNLYDINENLKLVAESWESNKSLLEREFFNTRIPVKEK